MAERVPQTAASLTFTTLFAMVPLITVTLAVFSAFPISVELGNKVRTFLLSTLLPETGAKLMSTYVTMFSVQASRLTAIGIVFLVTTSLLLLFAIERTFNGIWGVVKPRSVLKRLTIYWTALTVAPILLGLSLWVSSYLLGISMGWTQQVPGLFGLFLKAVPVAVTLLSFTLLYYFVPNRKVEWRHAITGGVLAGLVLEAMKYFFKLYVGSFANFSIVYGTFSAVPIFLLWLYFSWVVVLVGAIFTAALPEFGHNQLPGREHAAARMAMALRLLRRLYAANECGVPVALVEVASDMGLIPEDCERLLIELRNAGWVGQLEDERWTLIKHCDQIRLAEVYQHYFSLDTALADGMLPDSVRQALQRGGAVLEAELDKTLLSLFRTT